MDQQIDDRWLRRLAAVAAIVVLGLAACTADGGKESSGQGSDSGASSDAGGVPDSGVDASASDGGGSDEPDEFAMPPENEARTQPNPAHYPGIESPAYVGAQETARYFLDAMYYGFETGDTGPLESVSSDRCGECQSFVYATLARTRVYGVYDIGHSIHPQEMYEYDPYGGGMRAVYYAYYEGEHSTRLRDGTIEGDPGRNMHADIELEFQDGRWQVIYFVWGENSDV
ncbi:MAG: DUF6318 family protein [Dermabacter sp.]|nr:DUF6318 family protein [Dermabacter sp.]